MLTVNTEVGKSDAIYGPH